MSITRRSGDRITSKRKLAKRDAELRAGELSYCPRAKQNKRELRELYCTWRSISSDRELRMTKVSCRQ
ncbi:hypothetical protein CYMTET_16034 [Cymbomonas tetramitiformis]|uniref:Uncharacterized protein n=1 Tax=Cymbomonas tetramitiformis TaxID=36881 RepID=A0AAE0FVZ4_9CHLO|nr:hypothetical protein CYMTET_24381 [Cymbomonas tetramitiformis]KAK3275855.1 hypothetical protein CYMTET_16034 [Cymbomonas tetramitiformis]